MCYLLVLTEINVTHRLTDIGVGTCSFTDGCVIRIVYTEHSGGTEMVATTLSCIYHQYSHFVDGKTEAQSICPG